MCSMWHWVLSSRVIATSLSGDSSCRACRRDDCGRSPDVFLLMLACWLFCVSGIVYDGYSRIYILFRCLYVSMFLWLRTPLKMRWFIFQLKCTLVLLLHSCKPLHTRQVAVPELCHWKPCPNGCFMPNLKAILRYEAHENGLLWGHTDLDIWLPNSIQFIFEYKWTNCAKSEEIASRLWDITCTRIRLRQPENIVPPTMAAFSTDAGKCKVLGLYLW